MNDEELRGLLHEWEAPEPSPRLDRRVERLMGRSATRRWIWGGLAAAAALAIAVAAHVPGARARKAPAQVDNGRLETRVAAVGFRPLPEGEIRMIERKDAK